MIEWVIFDLGGVVVKHDAQRMYAAFSDLVGDKVAAVQDLLENDLWNRLVIGAVEADFAVETICRHLGGQVSPAEIIHAVNAELYGEFEETIDFIDTIKDSVRVGCLSNTNALHWELMLDSYQVFSRFEVSMASHLLRAAKPDHVVYERALAQLKAQPSTCVFIDDRIENAQAATELGWHGIHYTGLETLIADLARLGVG